MTNRSQTLWLLVWSFSGGALCGACGDDGGESATHLADAAHPARAEHVDAGTSDEVDNDACAGDRCGEPSQALEPEPTASAQCEGATVACEGACVNPYTDREHCGGCGQACAAHERCVAGACAGCAAPLDDALPIERELDTHGHGDALSGSCGSGDAEDLAFRFEAPRAGTYLFSSEGSRFNTVLYALADGCDGEELACSDDSGRGLSSRFELTLEQGQVIVLALDGFEGQTGRAQLHVRELSASTCCESSLDASCADADIAACVCAQDAFCCTEAWDASCVQAVDTLGCGSCGEGPTAACDIAQESDDPSVALVGELAALSDRVQPSCGAGAETDALFAFTAPSSDRYVFETAGSEIEDTVLAVYEGAECNGFELACNDDAGDVLSSRVSVTLSEGEQVLIAVESFDSELGAVTVAISTESEQPLSCEPTPMSGALPIVLQGQAQLSPNGLAPSCAEFGDSGDALFSFTAESVGRYRFDTAGSTSDTILQILDGDCSGEELACNDDVNEDTLEAAVELDLAADQTVLINVDSVLGEGSFTLQVDQLPAATE